MHPIKPLLLALATAITGFALTAAPSQANIGGPKEFADSIEEQRANVASIR